MGDTPQLHKSLLVGDNNHLLAELSCALAVRKRYLGVLDGPRMGRVDAEVEIVRRNNVAARYSPREIILAGLDPRAEHVFDGRFSSRTTFRVNSLSDLTSTGIPTRSNNLPLFRWGRKRIGIGLLLALRAKQQILFDDRESPNDSVPTIDGDLVVCEEGHDFAEVIAANYAFSIGAGLVLIPKIPDDDVRTILERFYSAQEARDASPTSILEDLKQELRVRSGHLHTAGIRSITFITNKVPWGFAYPEVPTTHLFSYPDLGLAILDGMTAEQPGQPGIRVALLIEPNEVQATEIETAISAFRQRSIFISGMSGLGATVYRVSRMVELFPYDFLLISTHCGDAPGWQWTYEFVDSEGRSRTLVTEVAIGVADLPHEEDLLEVQQYERFVSFDGLDWRDKSALNVGTAMQDWHGRRQRKELEPTKKSPIPRVLGGAVLKMADQNYLPMVQSLAGGGTPIIVNNACASWHELAQRFTFAGARAYIGTLTSVLDPEAEAVVSRILGRFIGKPLSYALWKVQNEVYGDSARRPYVLVGLGSQILRTTKMNALGHILNHMEAAYEHWVQSANEPIGVGRSKHSFEERARFLRQEIDRMRNDWLPKLRKK